MLRQQEDEVAALCRDCVLGQYDQHEYRVLALHDVLSQQHQRAQRSTARRGGARHHIWSTAPDGGDSGGQGGAVGGAAARRVPSDRWDFFHS